MLGDFSPHLKEEQDDTPQKEGMKCHKIVG